MSTTQKTLRLGIIGGGLMGREVASALGRWIALENFPVKMELVAICDVQEKVRDWFKRVPSVKHFVGDYRELLKIDEVDAVYVAVPHNLHQEIYLAVLQAGKDLLAEKPFGIDLAAARAIRDSAVKLKRFVRCSSEMPFLPGGQRAWQIAKSGQIGKVLEVRSAFLHSSDLEPNKPINWKRQTRTCGQAGVMADLGMHVVHLPLRLGWKPTRVYAQLSKFYNERPDGKGGMAACDTWDNALLHTDVNIDGQEVPMRMETKRLSPGDTNTWLFELLGTDGGVRYSTKDTKALWTFSRGKEQLWQRTDLGSQMVFPTVTGGIFEAGFADCFLQMLAAFAAERAGELGDRFGCATPDEAVSSHEIFEAALKSQQSKSAVAL